MDIFKNFVKPSGIVSLNVCVFLEFQKLHIQNVLFFCKNEVFCVKFPDILISLNTLLKITNGARVLHNNFFPRNLSRFLDIQDLEIPRTYSTIFIQFFTLILVKELGENVWSKCGASSLVN